MIRTFVCLAFFLASGKQIAYVDLTIPPKTPEINTSGVSRSSGGAVYDRRTPDPQTLPIRVRLSRVSSVVENGVPKDSVEVVVTNTGVSEITLPIGDDPVLVLAPYAKDRSELHLTILEGDDGYGFVGFGDSASSAAYPESLARLGPGDSVTFKLPIDRFLAYKRRALRNGAELRLTVRVQLGRVVIDQGSDLHMNVGEGIRSGNSLPWPPK